MITSARATTGTPEMQIRFNADSAGNYNRQQVFGSGATNGASRQNAATEIRALSQLSSAASRFGGGMALIPHYANTANHKVLIGHHGDGEDYVELITARWANTAAITSIAILTSSSTFVANSIFLLCAVDEHYAVVGAEQNLSSDGTVTFSSIPQLDGDLVVLGYCRTDRAAVSDDIDVSINADTTDANYARQRLSGSGATAASAAAADRALIEGVPGDNATANVFGAFVLSVSQHANGVKQPHILAVSGYHETSGPTSNVAVASGRRANIAAYTSMAFNPGAGGTNFKSGSLFSLYHVPKRLVAYEKLAADAAAITHTVPAGYEALMETVFARSDVAAATDVVQVSFNNDVTAANYDSQILEGNGAAVTAEQNAALRDALTVPAANAGANIFGGGHILIPAYAETDRHKHFLILDGPSDDKVVLRSMRWENTAAIAEIDLTPGTGPNFEGN